MKPATLVLLLKGNPTAEILLGYKKIGFGQGKFTGIGGKIEPGEKVVAAARRELAEETGVTVFSDSLVLAAVLEFRFPYKPEWEHRVHVFTARRWVGIPAESREIRPQWFPLDAIPYPKMWDDAYYWLPRLLKGENFEAKFVFKADNATVDQVKFFPLV
ncbi:MAG TPA: 8-oxo-dGTP diphosphatase, partial [Anaerolineales bacterium]|nr:8-oxo-dGTP diphosphatase [Anaerolineales bacterium]